MRVKHKKLLLADLHSWRLLHLHVRVRVGRKHFARAEVTSELARKPNPCLQLRVKMATASER
jgi:hypothetical protein